MIEIVSEDVMDWARDPAALRKFFADEPPTNSPINTQSIMLPFNRRQPVVNSAIEPTGSLICSSLTSMIAIKAA